MKFLKGFKRESRTYVKWIVTPKRLPQSKFIIFSRGRSGSTLLASLLNSIPHVHCDDELFQQRIQFPQAFIRCRSSLFTEPTYGFKLLSYQLSEVLRLVDPGNFMRWLQSSDYGFIYLERKNLLRHAVSNIYARNRSTFHSESATSREDFPKMELDIDTLFKWIRGSERLRAFEYKCLDGLPYLHITYEDNLADSLNHQLTIDTLTAYLGIPSAPVNSEYRRTTPLDLAMIISNYDEVVESINASAYAMYLD